MLEARGRAVYALSFPQQEASLDGIQEQIKKKKSYVNILISLTVGREKEWRGQVRR